ncbi:rCG35762 [Rattus norvegicus]|uniref:RCG35762 n=1 Tax=Rattus norvegicus TaxID=10116 RepID=A6IJH9_RAT|nr:rCG35762 [Rattus norvegicus]
MEMARSTSQTGIAVEGIADAHVHHLAATPQYEDPFLDGGRWKTLPECEALPDNTGRLVWPALFVWPSANKHTAAVSYNSPHFPPSFTNPDCIIERE